MGTKRVKDKMNEIFLGKQPAVVDRVSYNDPIIVAAGYGLKVSFRM